jgi:hypothetical protein
MFEAEAISAKFDDFLLTVFRHDSTWRVRVEELNYPNTALSGGIDYPSIEKAKKGAASIAVELFGTAVPPEELDWQAT